MKKQQTVAPQSNVKKFNSIRKYKYVTCEKCGRTILIDEHSVGGMCWMCVAKSVGMPEIKSDSEKSKFPPGWRFMSLFVDFEGNVYKHGELCEELKGTMEPTDVDRIKTEIKVKRIENKKRRMSRDEKLREKENNLREKAKKQEKITQVSKVIVKRKK